MKHRAPALVALALWLTLAACPSGAQAGADPAILAAYFGLDDGLPPLARLICWKGPGKDGLPLVLSHEIVNQTLDAEDFRVVTRANIRHTPLCASLRPANEEDEDRTILLIGDFGDARHDPPVRVEIVGSLLAENPGGQPLELQGLASGAVTNLADGPFIAWAQALDRAQARKKTLRSRSVCPAATVQAVRLYWAGGVSAPDGGQLGEPQRLAAWVELAGPLGGSRRVTPFALAELDDRDNVVDLCLKEPGRPLGAGVAAGMAADPGGDLNPVTQAEVHPPPKH